MSRAFLGLAVLLLLLAGVRHRRRAVGGTRCTKRTTADAFRRSARALRLRLLGSRGLEGEERAGAAYVGYSWGGNLGFLLAAVERRVHSFVLMSGVPDVGAHLATLPDAQALDRAALAAYLKTWEPLAGMRYVSHAAPSALYMQAGRLDDAPAPNESRQFFVAASEPKKLQLYEADHELDEQARSDRAAWLAQRFQPS
jgi:pimeloyl-ACP methyl ester carboxylesterase